MTVVGHRGVNLPAHTVIIKGTQVYSPEKVRILQKQPVFCTFPCFLLNFVYCVAL